MEFPNKAPWRNFASIQILVPNQYEVSLKGKIPVGRRWKGETRPYY